LKGVAINERLYNFILHAKQFFSHKAIYYIANLIISFGRFLFH